MPDYTSEYYLNLAKEKLRHDYHFTEDEIVRLERDHSRVLMVRAKMLEYELIDGAELAITPSFYEHLKAEHPIVANEIDLTEDCKLIGFEHDHIGWPIVGQPPKHFFVPVSIRMALAMRLAWIEANVWSPKPLS